MSLVVFAHTPPPHHGQSYMVQLMVEGLSESPGSASRSSKLRIIHVNARLSASFEAIGEVHWRKVLLLFRYCAQAIYLRFTSGAIALYYVPAPAKRAALYRDWLVMALCRPFYSTLILHWHAVGLGEWLRIGAKPWERWVSQLLLGRAELSIVLSEFARMDALELSPRKVAVVANGIPDPCPDFDQTLKGERIARAQARDVFHQKDGGRPFTVLFLGACTVEKGLFATVEAVAAYRSLAMESMPLRPIRLLVAGEFPSESIRLRFQERVERLDLTRRDGSPVVQFVGFAAKELKDSLFRQSDCLCFPSTYSAEGQPVTIIEALAYGLPIIATRWRGIPELLGSTATDAPLVDAPLPSLIAERIAELAAAPFSPAYREAFVSRFRLEHYLTNLQRVLGDSIN